MMNAKKTALSVLAVVAALGILLAVLLLRPDSEQAAGDADSGQTATLPEVGTNQSDFKEQSAPATAELSSRVKLPPEQDPATGKEVLTFPCTVPGYGLKLEKFAPYKGQFVEDGSNRNTENVAMLLMKNEGALPIEYATLTLQCGGETLQFDLSALPAGERAVVQEKTGKAFPAEDPLSAEAVIVNRNALEMNEDLVQVKEGDDGSLTITNISGKKIPTLRIFYKYYMKNEEVFVGGIAFTAALTDLAPAASTTIHPAHYRADSSRVVMVQCYEN